MIEVGEEPRRLEQDGDALTVAQRGFGEGLERRAPGRRAESEVAKAERPRLRRAVGSGARTAP